MTTVPIPAQTIVTLTMNPAIDRSTSVDSVAPERKLRCTKPRRDPGGGGINVSRVIRTLGGASLALWTRGGPTGELMRQLIEAEHIVHQPLPVADLTRENVIVYEQSSGQQYRFGMPGPTLTDDEVEACLQAFDRLDAPPKYVIATGSLPPSAPTDFYARLARRLADETRLLVDTSGKALHAAVEAGVYLIKPNMRELGELAGREIETDEQVVDVARRLIDAGKARVVITSLGAAGAMLVTAERTRRFESPTVPIRSKVGAGDSMVGAIALALERGEPIERATRFGIAAGAAAVMTPGTQLCRRDDTERLHREMIRRAGEDG